jgi:hypothetical protein
VTTSWQRRLGSAARSLVLPLAPAVLIAVLVTAFTWPTSRVDPRGVPVAVTGSPDFVDRTTQALDAAGADSFDVTVAPDQASGVELLRHNDADGVFEEGDPATRASAKLLLASAGRPAVAQLLTSVQTAMTDRAGAAPAVVTTVAAPSDDPRSAVFTAAAIPTVLGAIASGVLLSLYGGTRAKRLVGVVAGSALAGVLLTVVMDTWLGALAGGWWREWGLYSVAVAAVTAAVVGMHNVFGRVGMVVAAAGVLLLGNPLSGASSAPELLPHGWSTLGQAMPPGAMTSALRSIGFYDDHGAGGPVLVLAAWAAVGLLLLWAGPASWAHPRGVRTGAERAE